MEQVLESDVPETPCPFVPESPEEVVDSLTAEILNYTHLQTGIYPQEILDPEFINLYEIVVSQGDSWCKWSFCDEVLTKVRKIEELYRERQFDVYKSHLIAEQLLNLEKSSIQEIYEHLVNEKRVSQLNGEIVTSEDHSLVPWVNKQSLEWYVVQRGCLVLLINEVLTNPNLDSDSKDLVIKQLVEEYLKEKYSSINNNQAEPIDPKIETTKPNNINVNGKEKTGIAATVSAEDVPLDIAEKRRLVEISGYKVIRRGSIVVDIMEFIQNRSLDEAVQLIQLLGDEDMFPVVGNITIENGAKRRSIVFTKVIPDIYRDLILHFGYRLADIPPENGFVFVNTVRGQRTPTFRDVLVKMKGEVKTAKKKVMPKNLRAESVIPQKVFEVSNTTTGNPKKPRGRPKKSLDSKYNAQLKRRNGDFDFWGDVDVKEDMEFGAVQIQSRSGALGEINHVLEMARIQPVEIHSPIGISGTCVDGHANDGLIEHVWSIEEMCYGIHTATRKLSESVSSNGGKIHSLNVQRYSQKIRSLVFMFIQSVNEQEKGGKLKQGEKNELFTKLEDDIKSAYNKGLSKLPKDSSLGVLPDIKKSVDLVELIQNTKEFDGYQFTPIDTDVTFEARVFVKMHREGSDQDIYFYHTSNNRGSAPSESRKYSIRELHRFLDCIEFTNKNVKYDVETILRGLQGKDRKGRLFVIES